MDPHNVKISIIGLGYVGLPMAVEFAKKYSVVGFDINDRRIKELQSGIDHTNEVAQEDLKSAKIHFTSDPQQLREANFHIVAVPTPVDEAHQPNINILLSASKSVGGALKKGDIVVFESTVYPGCTEEDCIPVLEKESNLKAGKDFKVGYSPERINPGDKEHSFSSIVKVVSAQDEASLEVVSEVYGSVVTAGVYRAESIKVAEAAKVIENTQRDLNIALMNELSVLFDRMGIDTLSVLAAAGTKWNFLKFVPGLVGGHCIGVDPYYLTHKAEKIGYHPQVIIAGRRINDGMGKYIAGKTIKKLIQMGEPVAGSRFTVMGLTFKENCPDLRNSKVIDIIRELQEYGIDVQVCDPEADKEEAQQEYGVNLIEFEKLRPAKAVIFAVSHKSFVSLTAQQIKTLCDEKPLIYDVKGIFEPNDIRQMGIELLRM